MSIIKNGIKSLCVSLGKHNDALYAVLAIALFKGIMRPTFTMMDKKSDPETKKYAAVREGLTEAVAFVSYLATNAAVKKLTVPLCKAANILDKKEQVKHGLSFFSVCLSAAVIIPAVCNLTMKPIMNLVQRKSRIKQDLAVEKEIDKRNSNDIENIKEGKLDITENAGTQNLPVFHTLSQPANTSGSLIALVQKNAMTRNYGMKVGG